MIALVDELPVDRFDTEDGLPEEAGCIALVQGFWQQVRDDLGSWGDEQDAALEEAHAELTQIIRSPSRTKKAVQTARNRVNFLTDGRKLCADTVLWVLGNDKSAGAGFAAWCAMAGAGEDFARDVFRRDFTATFARFAPAGKD